MSAALTGSHCIILISVSCLFNGDFQFRPKIYLSVDNHWLLFITKSTRLRTGSAGLTFNLTYSCSDSFSIHPIIVFAQICSLKSFISKHYYCSLSVMSLFLSNICIFIFNTELLAEWNKKDFQSAKEQLLLYGSTKLMHFTQF